MFPLINIAEETKLRQDIGSSSEIEESDSDQSQNVELGMVTARLSDIKNEQPLMKMKSILDFNGKIREIEPINNMLSQ